MYNKAFELNHGTKSGKNEDLRDATLWIFMNLYETTINTETTPATNACMKSCYMEVISRSWLVSVYISSQLFQMHMDYLKRK